MRLSHRTILITRSAKQSETFRQLLEAEGARVLEVPTIAIQPRTDGTAAETISSLPRYHWVVFTSANAVEVWLNQIGKPLLDRWRAGDGLPRICSVGPATSRTLARWKLAAALVPEVFQAEGVVEAFRQSYPQGMKGIEVLFPAASGARQVIPEELRRLGAAVDFVPIYDTVPPPDGTARLEAALAQQPDLVAFTSSSTVHNFCAMTEDGPDLSRFHYAAIGPITAEAARDHGLLIEVQAPESTVPALAEAIASFFAEK